MRFILTKKISRLFFEIVKRPIRIFVFHQVSDIFEPYSMWECDWTSTIRFKQNILTLKKQGYAFISLPEAKQHLHKDIFRRKKYAVLTADDGGESLKNIIPWLIDNEIPITLFVNPNYMDGMHFRNHETEKYLSEKEISNLVNTSNNLVTIASHGWDHRDSQDLSIEEFISNCEKSEKFLQEMPGKITFYAFPYGKYTESEIRYLHSKQLTPVLCDGLKNYGRATVIHRECIDEGYSK